MSELLKKLEAEAGALKEQLTSLNLQIHDEQMRLIKERFGIEIGSIVLVKQEKYQVTRIRASDYIHKYRKPWIHGVKELKGGGFGTREMPLYEDWAVVQL